MNNLQAFKALLLYAVLVPVAIFLGYVLSDPMQRSTYITVTLLLAVLAAPLLLRFHYPIMLLSWNTTAVLFFLPGRPNIWLATIAVSFLIAFTHRILDKELHPIRVPELTRPFIAIVLVTLITAQLTGGVGVQALGGGVFGGRRYILLWFAILGYFALTTQRIPANRAGLYLGLFFLGGVTCFIGDLFPVLGDKIPFLFYVIPPYNLNVAELHLGASRLSGLTAASIGVFGFMMAKYGIRGIFMAGKPLRIVALLVFTGVGLYGGFRSMLLSLLAVFVVQFFLEGLHRTKLLPVFGAILLLGGAVTVPFISKLPQTVQRAMAFLPVPIDPMARESARNSSEWRLQMWRALLPEVPEYLLLGKGLAITREDLAFSTDYFFQTRTISERDWHAAVVGDYHNGPLSVIIPFGIWGVLVFVWFMVAALRVLYHNYRYGDPELRVINTALFAALIGKFFMFWFVVGALATDMLYFAGILGLSVAFNGGMARPALAPQAEPLRAKNEPPVWPRPRPVFGRHTN